MPEDSKTDIFANGDAYERYVGRWSRPVASEFLSWLSLSPGLRWVDVGCGTGALIETLLGNAAPQRVTGVEPSEAFLALARARLTDPRVEFKLGDAQALPLAAAEADVLVSGLALNFVPDKQGALAEMIRVVRPGGTIAAYVWDYAGEMQLMRYFWDAVAAQFPEAADRDEGKLFPICQPEPLAALFHGAGLSAVETTALDVPTVFADFEDYWSPFLGGQGPAGALCASLSADDQKRLGDYLRDRLPFSSDGTIPMIARAWAVRGIR